jgi:hypothetical protein
LLLASSYRLRYREAAEASAGQAPADKVTSGIKVGRMYI